MQNLVIWSKDACSVLLIPLSTKMTSKTAPLKPRFVTDAPIMRLPAIVDNDRFTSLCTLNIRPEKKESKLNQAIFHFDVISVIDDTTANTFHQVWRMNKYSNRHQDRHYHQANVPFIHVGIYIYTFPTKIRLKIRQYNRHSLSLSIFIP